MRDAHSPRVRRSSPTLAITMNRIATAALVSANVLVLALLSAYGVLVSLPGYGGERSLLVVATLLCVGAPHAALLYGRRASTAQLGTAVAIVMNVVWALLLLAAGAAAATGLAGLAALLIVIAPEFVIVCINTVALARKSYGRWLTGRSSGPPLASADLQR